MTGGGKTGKPNNELEEVKREGHGGVLGRIILTFVSLRMTSITLPITMRQSKTFQGSLK